MRSVLRKAFAAPTTSILVWWILFVAIEISVHGLLLYNGIWANIPKLVRRDDTWSEKVPLRFLLPPIIKPPIKEVPYYIGDSCILGLPGPKSCFPGHGYDFLMNDIEKLPPIYPGCKLVVTCVIDGRSGMSEAEINKKSEALRSKLLELHPDCEVVIIPHQEILQAANYSGFDKWHPTAMGFWLLRHRFPEEFPESLFGQTKSERVCNLMKPLIIKLFRLEPAPLKRMKAASET
jgi:hypothetical protein